MTEKEKLLELNEKLLMQIEKLQKENSELQEKLQKENSELQEKIENLKMKLSIYDSENRKLKHIVMSLPNGLEILEKKIIRK